MRDVVPLINYKSSRAMMRIFGLLYTKGVKDAHNATSKEQIEDYLERVSVHGRYALMGDGVTYDWRRWRSNLYFMCTEMRGMYRNALMMYIKGADKLTSVYGCFYPVSLRFYIQGVIDRMTTYMNETDFMIYCKSDGIDLKHFMRKTRKEYKPMDWSAYVAMVQSYGYELSDSEENEQVRKCDKCGVARYSRFAEAFWTSVQSRSGMKKIERMQSELERRELDKISERIEIKREYDEDIWPFGDED